MAVELLSGVLESLLKGGIIALYQKTKTIPKTYF